MTDRIYAKGSSLYNRETTTGGILSRHNRTEVTKHSNKAITSAHQGRL
jgi:hypothetical protein